MTQLSVRQYVDARYVKVDNYTVRLISAATRSYCLRHHIQYGRVRTVESARRYANTYDVEVLDKICSNYVGLRRKKREQTA